MKRTRFFLALAAGILFLAQDALAQQVEIGRAPRSTWEGPYIGVNAGGTLGTSYASDLNAFGSPINPIRPDVLHYDNAGFTGGLQAGYNWQRGRLVYGVETDLGYLNVDGDGTQVSQVIGEPSVGNVHAQQVLGFTTQTSATKSDLYMTLRGRIGFTLQDKWLLYATGGAILLHYDESITTSVNDATHTAFRPGWVVGGGIEYAMSNHWSLKGEYLYYGLEDGSVAFRNNNPPSGVNFSRFNYETTSYGHLVRLGLNYRFGVPERAPVTLSDKDGKQMLIPEPEFSWTGPYAGLHFGYGLGGLDWKDEPPDTKETLVKHYQQGIFGGVQTGVNYQFDSGLVLGVEGKFSGTDINKDSKHKLNDEPNLFDTSIDWMASATVRLGWACPHLFQGRLLPYVKAGMSDAHVTYHSTHIETGNTDTFDSEEGRFAPVIGGGFEYAFNKHWTAKLEYNFADYGTRIIHGRSIDDNLSEGEAYETKLRLHTVELGFNYKF